jgi:hypothetical protein
MNYCEFETAGGPKVEYRPGIGEIHGVEWLVCGKPARFKYDFENGSFMWCCADHWDYIHGYDDEGRGGSFKVPDAAFGRGKKLPEPDGESHEVQSPTKS